LESPCATQMSWTWADCAAMLASLSHEVFSEEPLAPKALLALDGEVVSVAPQAQRRVQ
jgi:hypothetical protein